MRSGETVTRSRHRKGCTAELHVGRLIELRMVAMDSASDWLAYWRRVATLLSELRGPVVSCVDLRALHSIPKEIGVPMLESMRENNSRVARTALLLPTQSTILRLHFERMFVAVVNPNRRICSDVAEVKAWLCSHLNKQEMSRLDDFLGPDT
jgi:hypothetical protein